MMFDPMGYMAKKVEKAAALEGLNLPPHIEDVCSVSRCISEDFCDFIKFWKHNGFWFFDSPSIIRKLAKTENISLDGTTLFYYEAFEKQYNQDTGGWEDFAPEPSFPLNVKVPKEADRQLLGYDVVTYYVLTSPECSPLSCNGLAKEIPANKYCLLDDFDEAKRLLEGGAFSNSEPGPYRIIAVYKMKEK